MTRMYLVLVTALGGCLLPGQQAPGGVVATGEQLAVVDDLKVWTTTAKEKVAETEYTDSDGHVIGKGATYADRTTTHTQKIWYPVQGAQQLRDEDFFRITGDEKALTDTENMRADGKKWRNRGFVGLGAGFVTSLVCYLIPNDIAKLALGLGGMAVMTGGYIAAYYGIHEMNPETHAVDRSVAERAALDYNAKLGKTAGLGYSRKF
jgi:hypothetical protein